MSKSLFYPHRPFRLSSCEFVTSNRRRGSQRNVKRSESHKFSYKPSFQSIYSAVYQTQTGRRKMALSVPRPCKSRQSQFPSFTSSIWRRSSFTIAQKHKRWLPNSIATEFTQNYPKNGFFPRRNFIRATAASALQDSDIGRIFLSDEVVKRKRNPFWGRKWNWLDRATVGVIIAMHLLCVFAPSTFNWGAFCTAVGLYFITGLLGITLSFHRNLSHKSFKLPKWLEYFFAYCGVQALQGNPIDWVSTHRYHHQFCDSEKDPHSPLEGFWFSHMGWLFDTNYIAERCGKRNNVGDLEKQPFYRFIQRTYAVHPVLLGSVLYAVGGFPYIVWGMGMRVVWVYHITWLVNSACHVWGKQAWNTGDLSRNNWWVAVVAFGEGWHNNHHAFEYSARHGLEWWQLDMTWYAVRVLEAAGLATEVKLPTTPHKERMAFR